MQLPFPLSGLLEFSLSTVDARNPARPKKPWNDDSPEKCPQTVVFHGFLGGAGFRPFTLSQNILLTPSSPGKRSLQELSEVQTPSGASW